MKKISDEKKRKIIESYKKSTIKNISQIAREYKVSKSFVWNLLKENGII